MSPISGNATTTHLVVRGRIESIILDSAISRFQSITKSCKLSCFLYVPSKHLLLLLLNIPFFLALGICTCCYVYFTNCSDISLRFQLPLRNLPKLLIWVGCPYDILPLHLDFPNIAFNTLGIAHLILLLTTDEKLYKNFVLFNKIRFIGM